MSARFGKNSNLRKTGGAYDILGGWFLATMAKRDYMNKAQITINNL